MAQIMEGVDDEIILIFLFLVFTCFVVAVLYLRSRRTHSRSIAEAHREIETASFSSEQRTETNSNAEQWSDDGTRCDSVLQNEDNDGPGSSDKTAQSSNKVSADFDCDGVRRRFKEQTQSSVETNASTSKAHGTSSSSVRNKVDENLSRNNYSSSDTSTGSSPGSSYSTNMGTNTLHSTNTGPSSTSSHGNNMEPSFSTPNSFGTDVVPNTPSSHVANVDQNIRSLNDTNTRPTIPSSQGNSTQATTATNTESERMAAIRVKYRETERVFTVDLFMKVGDLKRKCFPDEVRQGQTVRLIYSGRLLSNDNAPLSYYGVGNYSVIHAQISNAQQTNQSQREQQQVEESDIDVGQIFLPLLMIVLCGCWYGLITYRNLFSTMSTAILIVLTGAYALIVYAMIG